MKNFYKLVLIAGYEMDKDCLERIVSSRDENRVLVASPTIVESIDDIEENPSLDPNDELTIKEL
ncbi:10213_t:CDS:2 [Racocetra fulgida]|uniref:10213_t:CDS:1 n=1 Tax=Racocetra fulgida TaxID=60492 RepID=A0A9N9CJU7_9GLOM|nr:10213_t:CDS:2 [Racocetra fulgida]